MAVKKIKDYDIFKLSQIRDMLDFICEKYGSSIVNFSGGNINDRNGLAITANKDLVMFQKYDGYRNKVSDIIEQKINGIFNE
jgi:hypothetical protein